jgi:DNA-binding beta-propeller fold protein YncE
MKRLPGMGVSLLLGLLAVVGYCQGQQSRSLAKEGKLSTGEVFEGNISAPEFPPQLEWLNTEGRLTLGGLRGKIVLLDFWTFCCINCMHILPDLRKLEEKYTSELVVIGVHSAKFLNERDTAQIRQAILRYGIRHPVVNDHALEVWRSYGVSSWPTVVLINPRGKIVGERSGEGVFEPLDAAIRETIRHFDARGELQRGPLPPALEESRRASTLLAFPGKVSADPARSRLHITDSNHNRILITSAEGAIEEVIGSGEAGSRDGPFETAEFNHPQGTAVDGEVLYIADTDNHAIRAANLRTRQVTTVLGTGRQARGFGVAGRGTAVDLNSPWDIVVHAGKLYIAMAGSHQLWVADLATHAAQPYAGSDREGRIDGPLASAALAQPSGITTDGKRLYFADSESSSVRWADLGASGRVGTLIGEDLFEFGDRDGTRPHARLQHPLGVVFHEGLLYVADTYNSKIKIIDPARGTSTTLAGTGKPGWRDGKLAEAAFNEPGGLAFLQGKLFVADTNNHLIRVIDLAAKEVRTLEFSNQNKLARLEVERFRGRLVELPPAKIQAGRGVLRLALALPAGYKLARGAPFYFHWKSGNQQAVRFEVEPEAFDLHNPQFPLAVPLAAADGQAEVTVDAVVYYCTEKSTACFVDMVRLKAPVQVAAGAPAALQFTVPVKDPGRAQ